MEFRVLGPLEVTLDGQAIPLGGPKQRGVLAMLLLQANETVSRGRLVEGLWGENAPPTAQRSLDSYISRLRALVGADRVVRHAPGYSFRVEDGELDLAHFEHLVERALSRRGTEPRGALSDLQDAMALWRGPALADLLDEPFAQVEAGRLEDRRASVEEERLETMLALGEGPEAVGALEELIRREPLRERPHGQLMIALYRSGRAVEALEVFQSFRRLLADELGLEPGPSLHDLQRRILEHDPTLAPRTIRPSPPSRHRKRSLALLGLGAAVIAGIAGAIDLLAGRSETPHTDLNFAALVEVSAPSHEASVRLVSTPGGSTSGAGSVWVTEPDASEIVRIDPDSGSIVDRIPVVGSPGPIAFAAGAVWVTDVFGSRVLRIDPVTDRITQSVELGSRRAAALTASGDRLWVADVTENALVELDARSGSKLRTILLDHRPSALLAQNRTVWVASYEAGMVDAVDRRTGETIAGLHVGNGPVALAATGNAIWVANSLDSTVARINPTTGLVAPVLPVGSAPSSLATARGSLWVGNEYGGSVTRIDPRYARITGTTAVGGAAVSLAALRDRVWVGIRTLAQHRGGRLVLVHQRPLTIDPAIQLDLTPPQSDGLTRDSLVTFDHAPAPAGLGLVPDLAVSVPTPTDGGRTYRFRLRPGLRYSDGRFVRAADFQRSLERVYFLGAPSRELFDAIAGTDACEAGFHCDVSRGVVADEATRTITYHLSRPDPAFLFKLMSPAAAPIPRGTSLAQVGLTHRPIPGTGPYRVASATPQEIRYVRNPYFREWSHAAQPAGNPNVIVMRFGLNPAREAQAVARGTADWTADQIPASLLPRIAARFGDRLHSFSITETDFYRFNTRRPLFSDVRVRRAVNVALDRSRIARTYGGRIVATPTCQVLPPGLAGYKRYCPYTVRPRAGGAWIGPDLKRARALVAASGTRGRTVSLWGWTDDPTISPSAVREVARTLRVLGYRVNVRLVPHSYFDNGAIANAFATIDMLPAGWLDTGASAFFGPFVSCDGSFNRFFCDHRIDVLIGTAQRLEESAPRAAAAAWARVDRATVDQAASLPLVNPRQLDFVSTRVRNFQHHPYWDVLVDQLSIR